MVTDTSMEERLRRETWLLRDDLELAYEVLAETTGLTLDGVRSLMLLHRRSRGVQSMDFTADDVVQALGLRWWPTGVISRALLTNGGRGMTARQRSDHHQRVRALLEGLEAGGMLESRYVAEDGHVMTDTAEHGRSRAEWRRVTA